MSRPLGGGCFEVVAITEGGGALNTMVEGGEAKASLEIQPRGNLYASSAEASGCLTDTGLEKGNTIRCNRDCRY